MGKRHPDPVVENSSLAAVQPPDPTYELRLPSEVADEVKLSGLQLESVLYGCQRHEKFNSDGQRKGFFIGDGAGMGKGRTLAGFIYENIMQVGRMGLTSTRAPHDQL